MYRVSGAEHTVPRRSRFIRTFNPIFTAYYGLFILQFYNIWGIYTALFKWLGHICASIYKSKYCVIVLIVPYMAGNYCLPPAAEGILSVFCCFLNVSLAWSITSFFAGGA